MMTEIRAFPAGQLSFTLDHWSHLATPRVSLREVQLGNGLAWVRMVQPDEACLLLRDRLTGRIT